MSFVGADGTTVPERARILLVEDDPVVALDLEQILEGYGYEVVDQARDADGALSSARAAAPDLALLDIRLRGGADGIELARRLQDEVGVPTVFVSAHADDHTVARARQAGPFGFVVKPFTPATLRATIELALDRHRMERRLNDAQQRYRLLFEQSVAGVCVESLDGRLRDCNQAFAHMLGYASPKELRDHPTDALFRRREDADRYRLTLAEEGSVSAWEVELRKLDGSELWVMDSAAITRDPVTGEPEIVRTVVDITSRKEREEGLVRMAYHDALTSLPNRRLLEVRAQQTLAVARRQQSYAALLFLDLVGFKQVNDRLGHGAGDHLLVKVAERLRAILRTADTAARVGGDEFAVLLSGVEDPRAARRAAERLQGHLAAPYLVGARTVTVHARVALALYPDHGQDLSTLLARADEALSQAKAEGGPVIQIADREGRPRQPGEDWLVPPEEEPEPIRRPLSFSPPSTG